MNVDTKTLVKRLRALHILDEVGSNNPLGRDAADTIERLESECEKLEGELRLADAIITRFEMQLYKLKSGEENELV